MIVLEGDALEIVNTLRHEGSSWSRFGQLVEDTRVILNSLPSWAIRHVGKEANEVAYHLTKFALGQSTEQVWM